MCRDCYQGARGGELGAISVSGPQSRLKGDESEGELTEMVTSTADVIEMQIEVGEEEQPNLLVHARGLINYNCREHACDSRRSPR